MDPDYDNELAAAYIDYLDGIADDHHVDDYGYDDDYDDLVFDDDPVDDYGPDLLDDYFAVDEHERARIGGVDYDESDINRYIDGPVQLSDEFRAKHLDPVNAPANYINALGLSDLVVVSREKLAQYERTLVITADFVDTAESIDAVIAAAKRAVDWKH